MKSFKEELLDYLDILHQIAIFHESYAYSTPHVLEGKRAEAHRNLFENHIAPFLEDGTDVESAYIRSKDIFSNLDKVYRIFSITPFDLNDFGEMRMFSRELAHFLMGAEVLNYLEGKTQYIHNVIEPEDQNM